MRSPTGTRPTTRGSNTKPGNPPPCGLMTRRTPIALRAQSVSFMQPSGQISGLAYPQCPFVQGRATGNIPKSKRSGPSASLAIPPSPRK
eukprot:3509553-Rhodomonas_salina.1